MNDINREMMNAVSQAAKPQYETPVVRILTEAEVLAAFQVSATASQSFAVARCCQVDQLGFSLSGVTSTSGVDFG